MTLNTLIDHAIAVAQNAYAPYSQYRVGAALHTPDGDIFTGCNIENASYPVGLCGERSAIANAVSKGYRTFDTIVIATLNGGSPCGMCRQMLYEFAPDLRVVCVTFDKQITIDAPLRTLLPYGFSPQDLPSKP
jgi:cytidine deaminase